ncbi:MAG TPA: helix-turn-helix transcriptional regulator [Candidatus Limnocylindrales bacterium]
MPDRRRRRATRQRLAGRARAAEVCRRLGIALREARRSRRLRQVDVAEAAGISQSYVSRMERGHGTAASVTTWASVGEAVGLRLAAFFEDAPGATRPRDYEHLKRQELVIRTAKPGGWLAMPEMPVDPNAVRSRSVDVALRRIDEIAVIEVWDLLDDVGAALRGLDAKVAAVARAHPGATVRGVIILRRTTRNRQLVREFSALFAAKLPADAGSVLRAFTDPRTCLPRADALLWSDVAGERLIAPRR